MIPTLEPPGSSDDPGQPGGSFGKRAEGLRRRDELPLDYMKAIRNETEIRNLMNIYIEDSAVPTKFIYWLKKNVGKIPMTEGSAAAYLDHLRAKVRDYIELSFGTISAYGSNAFMMHYEPGEDGGAELKPEGMLLVDFIGHYLRGTTDVTRTMSLGPVTQDMRRSYSLTANSNFQPQDVVFPAGPCGMTLDDRRRAHGETSWITSAARATASATS